MEKLWKAGQAGTDSDAGGSPYAIGKLSVHADNIANFQAVEDKLLLWQLAAQRFQTHEDQRERNGQRAEYEQEDSPVEDLPPGCGCLLTLRLTLTSSSGLGLTLSRRGGRGVISHPGRAASAAFGWSRAGRG